MKPKFVDTNIFIRFITADNPTKAKHYYVLFKRCQKGEIYLTTTQTILSEVVYILSSKTLYKLPQKRIRDLLLPIVNLRGLKLHDKKVFINALNLYATLKIDFEDVLNAAYMLDKEITEIYSYDKDFDRFESIKRVEP